MKFSEKWNQKSKPLFYTPRRIFAIVGGMKKTDFVAVRIDKIGLSPKPFLIRWFRIERQSG